MLMERVNWSLDGTFIPTRAYMECITALQIGRRGRQKRFGDGGTASVGLGNPRSEGDGYGDKRHYERLESFLKGQCEKIQSLGDTTGLLISAPCRRMIYQAM
jgi:hypothetical protein